MKYRVENYWLGVCAQVARDTCGDHGRKCRVEHDCGEHSKGEPKEQLETNVDQCWAETKYRRAAYLLCSTKTETTLRSGYIAMELAKKIT